MPVSAVEGLLTSGDAASCGNSDGGGEGDGMTSMAAATAPPSPKSTKHTPVPDCSLPTMLFVPWDVELFDNNANKDRDGFGNG